MRRAVRSRTTTLVQLMRVAARMTEIPATQVTALTV